MQGFQAQKIYIILFTNNSFLARSKKKLKIFYDTLLFYIKFKYKI